MHRRLIFRATDRHHRLPEEVCVRELGSLVPDLRILVLQMVFPLTRETLFRKKNLEQFLDALSP